MATLTLRPSGAGTLTQLTPSAGNNWQNVDEAVADEDATYNARLTAGTNIRDRYAQSAGLPAGATAISVSVTVRAKASSAFVSTIQCGVYQDGDELADTPAGSAILTTSYANYTVDFSTTNPITATNWTVGDVNEIELLVALNVTSGTVRVTQVFATVTYTAVTPVTMLPGAVSATLAIPTPAFAFSAQLIQPSPAFATFAIPTPLFAGSGFTATLSPSPVFATFVIPTPDFSFGNLGLAPSPVVMHLAVPETEFFIPSPPASVGPGAWGMTYTRRRRRYGNS